MNFLLASSPHPPHRSQEMLNFFYEKNLKTENKRIAPGSEFNGIKRHASQFENRDYQVL